MRDVRWLGALCGVVAVASLTGEHEARACGGSFLPPTETETVTTDHRMILSVSKDQTTLYDQIEYHGSPSSFAWVLPIKGTVTIGLSADILFDTLDTLTATQVVEPSPNCPAPPACDFEAPNAAGAADDAGAAGGGGVTVTAQQQVGPYDTVQLHSTDPTALTTWLTAHGYAVPSSATPVIDGYVSDGFDFLAMKLIPGKGVKAMRPVRVTSQGASAVLPLRMVAVGTGATTGITLWVVADGRWEPQNFPFFIIKDSELTWDWTTNSSNYETLRLSKEAALGGKGWQIESSLELSQFTVQNTVTQNIEFAPPGTSSGGAYLPPTGDGGIATGDGGATDSGVTGSDSGGGDASAEETAAATQDLAVLFRGISGQNARFTRIRSDIAHAALVNDLTLQASSDQGELTNLYLTTSQIGQPECPIYNACNVVGEAPRNQAVAAANGGCNATPSTAGSPLALAGLAGFLGLGAIRARRRRRAGQ
jgi:MYXO-CTERM domain-containing protein